MRKWRLKSGRFFWSMESGKIRIFISMVRGSQPETKKYYYNDPEKLFVEDNQNPRDYFEYVADDHILSMSFEGPVYHMINGYAYGGLVRRFHKIFEKYGVYYEQGDAWNLTCYYA